MDSYAEIGSAAGGFAAAVGLVYAAVRRRGQASDDKPPVPTAELDAEIRQAIDQMLEDGTAMRRSIARLASDQQTLSTIGNAVEHHGAALRDVQARLRRLQGELQDLAALLNRSGEDRDRQLSQLAASTTRISRKVADLADLVESISNGG